MPYRVNLADRAVRDLDALYREKNVAESEMAARWYNGLEEAVYTLAHHPHRGSKAPEAKNMKRDLRQLLYGNRPHIYRIIYEIDEQRRALWILTIRHGARQALKAPDLA